MLSDYASVFPAAVRAVQGNHRIVWNILDDIEVTIRPPRRYNYLDSLIMSLFQCFQSTLRDPVRTETYQCSVNVAEYRLIFHLSEILRKDK